mmetsp:Transcript_21867/g.70394  ORF Transcript_21867/g.70394 Transcript_21867/m.70394 type:complete len:343 (+) Transcript_21867:985-2013(+)
MLNPNNPLFVPPRGSLCRQCVECLLLRLRCVVSVTASFGGVGCCFVEVVGARFEVLGLDGDAAGFVVGEETEELDVPALGHQAASHGADAAVVLSALVGAEADDADPRADEEEAAFFSPFVRDRGAAGLEVRLVQGRRVAEARFGVELAGDVDLGQELGQSRRLFALCVFVLVEDGAETMGDRDPFRPARRSGGVPLRGGGARRGAEDAVVAKLGRRRPPGEQHEVRQRRKDQVVPFAAFRRVHQGQKGHGPFRHARQAPGTLGLHDGEGLDEGLRRLEVGAREEAAKRRDVGRFLFVVVVDFRSVAVEGRRPSLEDAVLEIGVAGVVPLPRLGVARDRVPP